MTSMQSNTEKSSRAFIKHWGIYLVEAAALIGLLYASSKLLPQMPPLLVALIWAAVSVISATRITYHLLVRKLHKGLQYQEAGMLTRINSGRIMRIIICFVIAAACVASLFLSAPLWKTPEWCLVAVAIPLFFLVSIAVKKWVSREYKQDYQASNAASLSAIVTCVFLILVAMILFYLNPPVDYVNAAEAYKAAINPLSDSKSALLAEVGTITSTTGWLTDYLMSVYHRSSTGTAFPLVLYIARCALFASAMFGFVSLLSTFSIEWSELKKVFCNLTVYKTDANNHFESNSTSAVLRGRYIATFAALSVCLVAAFLFADGKMASIAETEEHSFAEQFIHDQVNMVVYMADGKYLDTRAVDKLLKETVLEGNQLTDQAKEELSSIVNDISNKQIENVENYLEWYYSISGDTTMLLAFVEGKSENFVNEQFYSLINEGVDTGAFEERYRRFQAQAEDLETKYDELLAQCEIKDVPDWMLTVSDKTLDDVKKDLEFKLPSQSFERVAKRLGISAAAGTVGGIAGAHLAGKLAGKQVFKRAAASLVAKALSAGGLPGLALSSLFHFGSIKIDEAINRNSYKEDIVSGINESREDLLAEIEKLGTVDESQSLASGDGSSGVAQGIG